MNYGVLGKLEVHRDGAELDVGAFRQRALLALLLTEPNAVLSTDSIIDALWGTDGTTDRQNSLWVYVSGIRKVLEPEREKRTEATVLVTRPPGYALIIEPDDLDSVRFERMIGEGRALAPTDPSAASLVFGEALGLWRGRAFEDFAYEAFAQTEITRLEALRQEAVEARIDADLARGMATELVSELSTLVRQHPLNERLAGQHMLALYRAGRQADALRAYQVITQHLGQELGIEPSTPLRSLEEQIVLGTVEVPSHLRAETIAPSTGVGVRGYELRDPIGQDEVGTTFRAYQPVVGREVAIKVVRSELANDPDFVRRFESDAHVIARLDHPNLVALYDYWREPDAAYLVMPLVGVQTLADILTAGALTNDQTMLMLEQIGGALHAAHQSGVVHGVINPSAVLIDEDGRAYLSNFGVSTDSQRAGSISAGSSVTVDTSISADVYDIASLAAGALTGLDGEVEQIRGALDPAVRKVIDGATIGGETNSGDRVETAREFVAAMRAALTDETTEPIHIDADEFVDNPYLGLRSFDAADAHTFFGRERLVERLITRFGSTGSKGRFIAIVGPSGSGKSSVAKAGLLPALRGGALVGSDTWFTTTMTPGSHPFEELESALRSIAIHPPASLLDELISEHGFERAIARILPDDGSQVVLVIDQFEELFTLTDDDTAQAFLDTLAAAVANAQSRLRVVITLRADFYDRPLRHLQIGELLREGTEVITPMTPEELERAITGPCEALGISYEKGLVAELITDVADRAGALPLLQYTLTELFDSRTGRMITHNSYLELGGVSGALVERADGLYAQLGDHAHNTVRQVFLRLVTFGEGAEDTRRRVLRTELEQLTVDQQVVDGVLDTFGRHRLLSFDRDPVTRGPTVEISHEALLREWLRLRNWIDDARHDVRSQRRLAGALAEWHVRGEHDHYLLTGGLLDELHAWSTQTDVTLTEPERAFLDRSVAEQTRTASEAADREERTRQAERVAQRRLRMLSGAAMVTLAVAALAIFGIVQWRSASEARDEATEARDEATNARNEKDSLVTVAGYITASETAFLTEPEKAVLYAAEAVKATVGLGYATEEAVDSLHWSLQQIGVQFDAGPDTPVAVRSGPYGLTGVFVLSPAELLAHVDRATTQALTDAECAEVTSAPCVDTEVPEDLPLRFGAEQYSISLPQVFDPAEPGPRPPLEGTRIVFADSSVFGGSAPLEAEFARFTEETGITVDVVDAAGLDVTRFIIDGNIVNPPDISTTFVPAVPEWSRDRALNLGTFLDEDQLRSDFGDTMVDLMSTGDGSEAEVQLVPVNVIPKGLIYYAKPMFDAAGYEIPETWDELVELSHQVLADGLAPWCFDWESGVASGSPGTDLIESLVLRNAGTEVYDGWVDGDVAFDSPEIIEAATLVENLLFEPGFVSGGAESISASGFIFSAEQLLDFDPDTGVPGPQCMFIHQQATLLNFLGQESIHVGAGKLGEDVGVFMLPPMEVDDVPVMTASGTVAFASSDRPEVRALMAYIASPAWGNRWAGRMELFNDPFISMNRRFDLFHYESDGVVRRSFGDAEVRRDVHRALGAAIEAGTFRWDAENQMPIGFATWTEEFTPGPVWQGMLDWVDQKKPIEQILADIEAVRPAS